jgi:hypothetical protein
MHPNPNKKIGLGTKLCGLWKVWVYRYYTDYLKRMIYCFKQYSCCSFKGDQNWQIWKRGALTSSTLAIHAPTTLGAELFSCRLPHGVYIACEEGAGHKGIQQVCVLQHGLAAVHKVLEWICLLMEVELVKWFWVDFHLSGGCELP